MNDFATAVAPHEPAQAVGPPLLEVEELRTTFSTQHGTVRAVDGVSLQLRPGETLGVVGESGSGKSVMGRTVMGLISSDGTTSVSGRVLLAGNDVHALKPARRRRLWGPEVAMVFQDPMTSLNPVKKVGTHLIEPLRLHLGLGKAEASERSVELLQQVGIPEPTRRLRQYPHELSGGMRQRVVIAMALACKPRLLIADEPTTALDVTVQKQILDLLASLAEDLQMATILISHDLSAVAGRTDRVAVMYGGRIMETSASERVFVDPWHPYAEALIRSIPQIDAPSHSTLRVIEGSPLNMVDPPPGCSFNPRCRLATSLCEEHVPALRDLGTSDSPHAVACHHPLGPAGTSARAPHDEREDGSTDGR